MFNDEFDMLEFRLEEYDEHVDYFVLVESNLTHSGVDKKFLFDENKERYSKFLHKIVHVKVDDLPRHIEQTDDSQYFYTLMGNPIWPDIANIDNFIDLCKKNNTTIDSWIREFVNRDRISIGLKRLDLKDDDIILISDIDEIIDVNFLDVIKNCPPEGDYRLPYKKGKLDKPYFILQKFYYYNLECIYQHNWAKMIICRFQDIKNYNYNCNAFRFMNFDSMGPAGWHFSYFGNMEIIKSKIKSFSHQEFNTDEYLDEEKLTYRIKNKIDLFGRDFGEKNKMWGESKFDINDHWPKKLSLLQKLFNI